MAISDNNNMISFFRRKKKSKCVEASNIDQTSQLYLKERLDILHKQELSYTSNDYLHTVADTSQVQALGSNFNTSNSNTVIDQSRRCIMVHWTMEVMNALSANEETVLVAISILDRFLSTPNGKFTLYEIRWFQLATICSIQLAIKMKESRLIELDNWKRQITLDFTTKQIIEMEREILYALSWRLCPPTAYDFLEVLIDLLPTSTMNVTSTSFKSTVQKIAKKYIHSSLSHYFFSLEKPSHVAVASILNAMEELNVTPFFNNDIFEGDFLIVECNCLRKKLVNILELDVFVVNHCSKKLKTNESVLRQHCSSIHLVE